MTRDFAYGEADPLIRRCRLLPWAPADLLDLSSSTPEPPAEHYQVWPPPPPRGLLTWGPLEHSLPSHQIWLSASWLPREVEESRGCQRQGLSPGSERELP